MKAVESKSEKEATPLLPEFFTALRKVEKQLYSALILRTANFIFAEREARRNAKKLIPTSSITRGNTIYIDWKVASKDDLERLADEIVHKHKTSQTDIR